MLSSKEMELTTKFKSQTKLFVFHFTLMHLEKSYILFSPAAASYG